MRERLLLKLLKGKIREEGRESARGLGNGEWLGWTCLIGCMALELFDAN